MILVCLRTFLVLVLEFPRFFFPFQKGNVNTHQTQWPYKFNVFVFANWLWWVCNKGFVSMSYLAEKSLFLCFVKSKFDNNGIMTSMYWIGKWTESILNVKLIISRVGGKHKLKLYKFVYFMDQCWYHATCNNKIYTFRW